MSPTQCAGFHAVWGCSLGISWAELFPFNQLMGSLGVGMAATLLPTEAATGEGVGTSPSPWGARDQEAWELEWKNYRIIFMRL